MGPINPSNEFLLSAKQKNLLTWIILSVTRLCFMDNSTARAFIHAGFVGFAPHSK